MGIDAVIMLVVGGLLLWGGLAVAVAHYYRRSRSETPG